MNDPYMVVTNVDLSGEVNTSIELNGEVNIGSSGGTANYDYLYNKPKINNVELINDKTFEELGINEVSNTELDALFKDL